jgi:hypothetical protein
VRGEGFAVDVWAGPSVIVSDAAGERHGLRKDVELAAPSEAVNVNVV